ncbi:MAG TPA: hypothetical protein VIE36_23610 [Methylomirabilota bacterium]
MNDRSSISASSASVKYGRGYSPASVFELSRTSFSVKNVSTTTSGEYAVARCVKVSAAWAVLYPDTPKLSTSRRRPPNASQAWRCPSSRLQNVCSSGTCMASTIESPSTAMRTEPADLLLERSRSRQPSLLIVTYAPPSSAYQPAACGRSR